MAAADHAYTTPAKPLHNAGICLMQMGDESGAEGYLLRAFKVDPSNAVAMYNLAELYLKRGTYDRAKFYSDRLLATYQPRPRRCGKAFAWLVWATTRPMPTS